MAGGLGFEPRLAESESAVLPLDDPPPRWALTLEYRANIGPILGCKLFSKRQPEAGLAGPVERGGILVETARGFKTFARAFFTSRANVFTLPGRCR